jgi:hypothetical protein
MRAAPTDVDEIALAAMVHAVSGNTRGSPYGVRRRREGLKKVIRRDAHDRPDIWFVLPDGANLEECLHDAAGAIAREALSWFELTHPEA